MPLTPSVDMTGRAQARRGRRRPASRRPTVFAAVTALVMSCLLAPGSASARPVDTEPEATTRAPAANQLQAQVLTWTASDSIPGVQSRRPTTAVGGSGHHRLREQRRHRQHHRHAAHAHVRHLATPSYNNDVNVNILADPFDANGGRHTVDVTLTPARTATSARSPGTARWRELVVTDGGGEDTTPPQVTAQVAGEQDEDGAYVGAATVTLTASDTESGVGHAWSTRSTAGRSRHYSAPVTVNAPGAHTVQLPGHRQGGQHLAPCSRWSSRWSAPQDEDTTPPTVTAAGDRRPGRGRRLRGRGDGHHHRHATPAPGWTPSSTRSTVSAFAAYTQPVTVNQPGEHTVTYRATDEAGNTSPVGSVAFQVAALAGPGQHPPQVTAAAVRARRTRRRTTSARRP